MLKKVLLLVLCLFSVNAWAASQQQTVRQLSELLNSAKSLRAQFSETITDVQGTVLQVAHGKFWLLRPSYFWWQVDKPNAQVIAIDGQKKAALYQPALQQLTIRPFGVNETQTPAALLLNGSAAVLSSHYYVTRVAKGTAVIFKLLPKKNHHLLQSIRIVFVNNVLTSLNLADHFNRVTSIQFQQVEVNPGLTPAQFKLHVPKGTDIINE